MLPRSTLMRNAAPLLRRSQLSVAAAPKAFSAACRLRATADEDANDPSVTDPGMNGGYPVLPSIKRQHRDPYGDWWDKQDRRNFGEPVHEDNDILGVFTTEDYTHVTPGRGAIWFGTFWVVFAGVIATVYQYYPDKPAVARTFPGGLVEELGGSNAVSAPAEQ